MRKLLLILALGLPLTFTACTESPREEAVEEGAPPGDREDVIGDGEIIDEPGELEGNAFLDYDADGDGYLTDTEYAAGINDANFALYDTDSDGRVSQAEYDIYVRDHM